MTRGVQASNQPITRFDDPSRGGADHWESLVDVLRKGIVRISHAASGLDPSLDRRLFDLRKAIRNDDQPETLDALVEAVSSAVVAMDSQHRSDLQRLMQASDDLLSSLDQVPLSWQLKRRKKATRSKLEAQTPDFAAFLADFSKLLQCAIQERDRQTKDSGTGLMKRVFGSSAKPQIDPEIENSIEQMRKTLIVLVNHIDVGGDLRKIAKGIRARLTQGIEPGHLPQILSSIADLAESATMIEKKRFEDFAKKLSEELQQLNELIETITGTQKERTQDTEGLENSLQHRASQIRMHVTSSRDLSQLQRSVDEEIGGMLESLSQFHESEQVRNKKFEASIGLLQKKLGEAHSECEDLYSQLESLRRKNMLDPLTGLPNRSGFMDRAQQEYERAIRYAHPLSALVVDIDHFKSVNDRYGHLAGDTVIMEVGSVIANSLRASDFVCRYGGEEFVVLLPETTEDQALSVGEKIRHAVRQCPFAFRDRRVQVTVSVGVAQLGPRQSIVDLIERADVALYSAKAAGRDRVAATAYH